MERKIYLDKVIDMAFDKVMSRLVEEERERLNRQKFLAVFYWAGERDKAQEQLAKESGIANPNYKRGRDLCARKETEQLRKVLLLK